MAIIVVSDKPLKGVQRFLADAIRGAEESQSVGGCLGRFKEKWGC